MKHYSAYQADMSNLLGSMRHIYSEVILPSEDSDAQGN